MPPQFKLTFWLSLQILMRGACLNLTALLLLPRLLKKSFKPRRIYMKLYGRHKNLTSYYALSQRCCKKRLRYKANKIVGTIKHKLTARTPPIGHRAYRGAARWLHTSVLDGLNLYLPVARCARCSSVVRILTLYKNAVTHLCFWWLLYSNNYYWFFCYLFSVFLVLFSLLTTFTNFAQPTPA